MNFGTANYFGVSEYFRRFIGRNGFFPIFLTSESRAASLPNDRAYLRATASKYRESADSEENSDFLLLRQKEKFGFSFISRSEIHQGTGTSFKISTNR